MMGRTLLAAAQAHLGRFGPGLASSSEGALVAFAASLARLLTDVGQQVLCLTWPIVPCSSLLSDSFHDKAQVTDITVDM